MAKNKKRIIWIIIIIALFFGGYFYFKSKKPETVYTTVEVQKGKLARTVSVTGEISSPTEADLSFKLSGRIESLLVDIGDKVQKWQKIATIDKGTLPEDLARARRELAYQRDTLRNMERQDTYKYFQKKAQEEQIRVAEIAMDKIQKQISDTTLYAPVTGVVIKKNVDVGEITVANAVTSNTSVVTIASDGELEIKVNVPESDIIDIKLGQKAEVSLDAFPTSEKFSAEVIEVEPASTVIQDVVYYKVKLKLYNPDQNFKVGMSADADINTAEKDNVVMVSQRAVKGEGENKYVEILLPDEKSTKRVDVKTGLSGDDAMVEIISGLSGGEKVVVLASEK